MSTMKRFAIADDHDYWRKILIDIIQKDISDAEIVIEATNGKQLIEKLAEIGPESDDPSVVILDLSMPILNGFEVASWLYFNRPAMKIITLSLMQDERSIIRLLKHGVLGFLHKNINGPDLIAGIETVLKGELYFSAFENSQGDDLHFQLESLLKTKDIIHKWDSLSPQAQEFVRLCCSDLRYKEMAKKMKVDINVVASLAMRVFKHFGVIDRISLVLLAYKNKLILI